MGKAPVVIIIARHGARLDAEDPQWTATSPAPYDTPLTYGGWVQTRALGARIASLLHARELAHANAAASASDHDFNTKRRSSDTSTHSASSSTAPRKKQRIVIHSSPFVRCVQSSVAIAAGMAQYKGNLQKFEAMDPQKPVPTPASHPTPPPPPPNSSPRLFATVPRSQTLGAADLPATLAASKAGSAKPERQSDESMPDLIKPTLRIDAFLGEWLSPDYFEHIKPPPPSATMLEGAKRELMRSTDPIQGAKLDGVGDAAKAPGTVAASHPDTSRSGALTMQTLADALPTQAPPKSSLQGSRKDGTSTPSNMAESRAALARATFTGYSPPTPLYAISPGEPIPAGYVGHARDACVNIDFPWDSMQHPQNWGDGGEHGEEWSSMHTRFRYGIKNMIDWYKLRGADFDPQLHVQEAAGDSPAQDDDSETVLILVTHGAGCNALIGALTNQPVLLDVGMASLTMAVRKANAPANDPSVSLTSPRRSSSASASTSQSRTRRSSTDLGLSLEYDMRLIASSEHLRAGADPLKIPQLQATSLMSSIPEGVQSRRGSSSSSVMSSPMELDRPRPKNSSLGSIRRSTVKSLSSRSYTPGQAARPSPGASASAGLWGSQRQSTTDSSGDTPESPTSNMLPDFGNAGPPWSGGGGGGSSSSSSVHFADQARGGMWNSNNGSSQDYLSRRGTVGLWGSQASPAAASRRSTVSERA